MRTILIATLALTVLNADRLVAQRTDNPPARPPGVESQVKTEGRLRIERQIKSQIKKMRRAMSEGLPVRTNVQVKVKLKNGNKLTGVVRNGRFVERLDQLDFVASEKKAPGAGIRVWYYDDTTSYIFLSFEEIAQYKIGARLTNVQVKQIENRIAKSEAEAKARRDAAMRRREQARTSRAERGRQADQAKADAKEAEADAKREKEEKRLLKLVADYPPEDGWGPDRLRDIQIRKITIGSFPDERSKRFIEVFDDWQKGYALLQKRNGADKASGDGNKAESTGSAKKATSGKGKTPGKSGK